MLFRCKACGATLQKEDIDLRTGIASCQHCHAVMSFAESLGLAPPQPREAAVTGSEPAKMELTATRKRTPAGRPENLRIEETASTLRFTRRWFTPQIFFLLFFCIAWNAFLIGWYAIGSSMPGPFGMKLIMFVFPIVHVAVGVGLLYTVLAGLLNRTVIEAGHGIIRVRHGPIPAKGNLRLPSSSIRQLYCKEKVKRTKTASVPNYQLHALLANGESKQLTSHIDDLETVLYLEQALERRLGLEDAPVAGEHRG